MPERREFLDQDGDEPREAISAANAGEDYALVIGVNDYPQLRPLSGAIADAQAFAAWLLDAQGGGLRSENVRSILSTSTPLTPLGQEINDALEDILLRAERSGGRRFYFYFSGHGAVGDRASDLALCLANWSTLRRRAALSSEAWLDVLVRSGIFDEVAFFLDCCRVWATRAVGLPPHIDFAKPLERKRGTRVFLAYATEFQRAAIEVAEKSTEVRGIFTRVLVDGLQSKACDERGKVTATSLKNYLEKYTRSHALTLGFHQHAEVLNGFDDGAQFGPQSDPRRPPVMTKYSLNLASMSRRRPLERLYCDPVPFTKRYEARLFLVLVNPSSTEWSIAQGEESVNVTIEMRTVRRDEEYAEIWHEYSHVTKPGAYLLRCSGVPGREVAVHLYPGWTTQVVIDDASIPHFEKAHVLIVAPSERNEPLLVAKGLALLGSGMGDLPPEWSDVVQAGDLEDPMLGLITAHLLARAKTPNVLRIETIVDRVEAMLGRCVDVDALRLRLALLRGTTIPKFGWTDPPMLREGLLAFVQASHALPELIPPGSLFEFACIERLVDSPLSSWPIRPDGVDNDDWVTTSIEDLATQSGDDLVTLDATTIARELGVPTHAVTTRLAVTQVHRTIENALSELLSVDSSSDATVQMTTLKPGGSRTLSIPGYQIEELVGKGGMGAVYVAKHVATGARVALKVIRQDAEVSRADRRRFMREISVLSVMRHDHIVAVLDHGVADGFFYYVMPYYKRGNLADWVRRQGRPQPRDAVRIILDVLDGLAHLHRLGHVHRDIKPQNLLIDDCDKVVLADFGLAKGIDEADTWGISSYAAPDRRPRWRGTPGFMPLEQASDFRGVRPWTDVWAVAAVFYWLLCGMTPAGNSRAGRFFLWGTGEPNHSNTQTIARITSRTVRIAR